MKANSSNFYGIKEEKQFSNPRVRFRRIRGRIVPIFNKKRIGKDLDKVGTRVALAGGALAAAHAGVAAAKKMGFGIDSNSPGQKFLKARKFTKSSKLIRAAKLISKIGMSKKTAGALVVGGLAGRSVGFEVQARSPFGYDVGGD